MKDALGTTSNLGRSRFGGGTKTLIGISLLIGAVISTGAGAIFATLQAPDDFAVATLVFAAVTLPCFSVAVWALLVDRQSITGATKNPEISVESQWYDRAALGVFQDILIVCGLGATVMAFFDFSANIALVLAMLLALIMLDFAVRYWLIKRKDS